MLFNTARRNELVDNLKTLLDIFTDHMEILTPITRLLEILV